MSEGIPTGGASCEGGHCVTCSDEAVAMTVVQIDRARELALCEDSARARSTVEIALIDPVSTGERVLVHAGVAIAALGRDEGAVLAS